MAGGVSIGMIGGNILQQTKAIVSEYMPVTKSMNGGGGLGGLMSMVTGGGGLGSILSNPMQAPAGQLQGAITQATTALSGMSGAGGLISALGGGGLSGAAAALLSAGNGLLSGQGQLGIAAHSNIVSMVGTALPASLSLDAVLGPVTAGGALAGMASWVQGIPAQIAAGTTTITAATAQANAFTGTISGITAGSANALVSVSGIANDVAGLSTVAAMLVAGPPALQAVLNQAIAPNVQDTMRASVAEHLTS